MIIETLIIGVLLGNDKTRNSIINTVKNIANTTIDTFNNVKTGGVDVSEVNAKTNEIKEQI